MALAMHSPLPKLDNKRPKLNLTRYHGCSHFCTINQSEEKKQKVKMFTMSNKLHQQLFPPHISSISQLIKIHMHTLIFSSF